jgi:hypothetical protein
MRRAPEAVPAPLAKVAGVAPARLVFALWLAKLGKHLAVLACLLIVGHASGRLHVSQVTVFALIIIATISHWSSKVCFSRAQTKTQP